jgi:hypothetical protein
VSYSPIVAQHLESSVFTFLQHTKHWNICLSNILYISIINFKVITTRNLKWAQKSPISRESWGFHGGDVSRWGLLERTRGNTDLTNGGILPQHCTTSYLRKPQLETLISFFPIRLRKLRTRLYQLFQLLNHTFFKGTRFYPKFPDWPSGARTANGIAHCH